MSAPVNVTIAAAMRGRPSVALRALQVASTPGPYAVVYEVEEAGDKTSVFLATVSCPDPAPLESKGGTP